MNEPTITVVNAEERQRRVPTRRGESWREYHSKPRLYIAMERESVLENLMYRHDRPVTVYRKALPEIFERLRIPVVTKARWSQKAGCSCGCSPGFVLDLPGVRDFWALVRCEQPVTARATSRLAEIANDPTLSPEILSTRLS